MGDFSQAGGQLGTPFDPSQLGITGRGVDSLAAMISGIPGNDEGTVNDIIGQLRGAPTGPSGGVMAGLSGFTPRGAAGNATLQEMLTTGAPVDVSGATTAAQGRGQRAFADFLNQSAESFGALNLGSSSAVQAARQRRGQELSDMIAETGMLAEIQAGENAANRRMSALGEERSGQELQLQRLLGQGGLELEGQRIRGSNLNNALQGAGASAGRLLQGRLGQGSLALQGAGMMQPFSGGSSVVAKPRSIGGSKFMARSGGSGGIKYNQSPVYTRGGKTFSEAQVMSSKRPTAFTYHAPGSYGRYQSGAGYAEGGVIPGEGPPDGEDNILAAVRSGELIVPEPLTKQILNGSIDGERLLKQLQGLAEKSNEEIDIVTEFEDGGIPSYARGGRAPWMVDGMLPWQAERAKERERDFENWLFNHGAEHAKNFGYGMSQLATKSNEERAQVFKKLAEQNLGGRESAFELFMDPEKQKEAYSRGLEWEKRWRGAPQVILPSAGVSPGTNYLGIGYRELRDEGKPVSGVYDQSAEQVEKAIRQQAAAGSPKAQEQVAAMDFDPKQAAEDLREQQWRKGREDYLTGAYERSNQRMANRRFNENAISQIEQNLGPGGFPQFAKGGMPSYEHGGIPWWAMYENMEATEEPALPDIFTFLKEFSPQPLEGGNLAPPPEAAYDDGSAFVGPMQQEAQGQFSMTGADGRDVLATGLTPGQETQFGTTRGKGKGGLSVMGAEPESELEKQRRRRDLANARVDLLSSYMLEKPTPRLAQALQQAQVEARTSNELVMATEQSLIQAQNALNDAKLREAQWKTAEANYARATQYTPKDELDALKLELTRVASGMPPREGEEMPTEEDVAGARAVLKIAEKDPMSATMMTQILKLGDANLINLMFNQMGWDVSARYPNIIDRIKSFVTGSPGISNGMILEPGGQFNNTSDALAKRRAELNDLFMQLAAMQGQGQQ